MPWCHIVVHFEVKIEPFYSRLEMAQQLFVVMRVCSLVVLSCLDASFYPRCCSKDFNRLLLLAAAAAAACLLLLAKICCSSVDLKKWCKTSTG